MKKKRQVERRNFISTVVVSAGIAVLLSSALTACIPVSTNFYEPSAPIGQSQNFTCGMAGPPNTLFVKRENVYFKYNVASGQNSRGSRWFEIQISIGIPTDTIVDFELNKVHVLNQSTINIKKYVVQANDPKDNGAVKTLSLPVVFTGSRYSTKRSPNTVYSIWLNLAGAPPNKFYLQMPKVTIDGRSYSPFVVKFVKKHGTYIMPINGC